MSTLNQPIPEQQVEPNATGPFGSMRRLMPKGEVVRFLAVGVFNTVFALGCYMVLVTVYGHLLPHKWILAVPDLASISAKPIGITVAFFCYKFIVFRTKGNYLREWLRCFAVYGVGMIPELIALPLITKGLLHFQMLGLQHLLHLPRHPAPYLAGLIVSVLTAILSYLGHKKFSFKT
ncbi:Putative flippase GtrA (transmembrane translocase of bactoprenol-linked glucose) [Granulicella rosea]|uniref:Putative flippase GtrA (Transmembrane translocase of bactoprenol-linked glucose) n=1 Tax=Granulicella rosea TaxID=474952 RepID=A0A239IXP3_9BACT|nr:GtrA family protein [Granulicella rosea]SNS98397.1 Putative flippase GtrA (transmembrane translocase of bactoprenol-linked glucose) [Granulicella rosea]